MQSSVPKFGSFRPKAKATLPSETQDKRNNREDGEHTKEQRERKHESVSRTYKNSNIESNSVEPHVQESLNGVLDSPNDLYVLDAKGDQETLKYGSINSSSVPQYRAPSTFRVLGQSRGETFSNHSGRSMLSSLDRHERKRLEADGRLYRPHNDYEKNMVTMNHEFEELEFLPLDKRKKRKRRAPLMQSSPETSTVFRAESGEEQDTDSSGRSSQISETDVKVPEQDSQLKQENARLSKQVKLEPSNVNAWREYINFQSQWLSHERSTTEETFSIEDTRSIAEVKLSMYKKALKATGKDHHSKETLLLEMMREARKVYESSVLMTQWGEIAHANNDCFQLWSEYIKFAQTTYGGFQFEPCKTLYQELLKNLSEKARKADGDAQQVENLQVDVLLRMACFVRDSGYVELATALWQGLLEINFFRPSSPSMLKDDTADISGFEDFWDSECPRIGEDGARGWRNMKGNEHAPLRKPLQQLSESPGNESLFYRWEAQERRQSCKTTIPGRTSIDEDGEDPFRVVLFSDLQPLLTTFSTKASRLALINAFLCFNGLPILRTGLDDEPSSRWSGDPMITSRTPEFKDTQGSQIQTELENFSPDCFHRYQTTTETLFSSTNRILSLLEWSTDIGMLSRTLELLVTAILEDEYLAELYLAFLAHTDTPKARKKAKSFLKLRPSSFRLYNAYALIEERLGNEDTSSHVFSTAIKMTSSFDTSDQAEIVLLRRNWVWSALKSSNNREKSLKRLILSSRENPADMNQDQNLVLSDSEIMQADINLRKNLDEVLSRFTKNTATQLWRIIPYHAELLMLLIYLNTDLNNTLTNYEHQSSYISAILQNASSTHTTAVVEHLHQLRAELIRYHTHTQSAFSPTVVRSSLQESLSFFPENSILLSAQLQNEALFKFDDRVRSVMRETINETGMSNRETIQAHVFLISLELRRYYRGELGISASSDARAIVSTELHDTPPPLTTPHAIRTVFERALSPQFSTTGEKGLATNSATLWRIYLMFEIEQLQRSWSIHSRLQTAESNYKRQTRHPTSQDMDHDLVKQRQRVRNVYFRGLRALPWHKDFAMLAFQRLYEDKHEPLFTENEMQAIYDGMSARGLRLLVELP